MGKQEVKEVLREYLRGQLSKEEAKEHLQFLGIPENSAEKILNNAAEYFEELVAGGV